MSGTMRTGSLTSLTGSDLIVKASATKQLNLGTDGTLYKWPTTTGSANFILKTDGSNNLGFASITSLLPVFRIRNWCFQSTTGSAAFGGPAKTLTSFWFDGTNVGDQFDVQNFTAIIQSLSTAGGTATVTIRNTGTGTGVVNPYTVTISGSIPTTTGAFARLSTTVMTNPGNIPTGPSIFEITGSSGGSSSSFAINNIILPN